MLDDASLHFCILPRAPPRRLAALFFGGGANAPNIGINFGIPMSLILKNSSVLIETPPAAPKQLPLLMSVFPKRVGVGDELFLVADLPVDCAPYFVDISAGLQLTPLEVEIFEQVKLSTLQTRYQITPTSTYFVDVKEEDEKGEHKLGALCAPSDLTDPAQLTAALRAVVGALRNGQLDGQVTVDGGQVDFVFAAYVIE
jgi:hypothetical protein